MFVTVELLYGTWGKRERKRATVILYNIRCEYRGYRSVLKAVEKWGGGDRRSSGKREQS
jgi:hypothetical protein